jgi:hypothetical protein
MNRKEFKTALFSYCELLGYNITEYSVEFEPFGPSLFYFSKFDGSFNYTPISPKGKFTTLRRMKIDYNEETLEIYKCIARKWYIIFKEYKIKKKIDSINQDF